MKHVTNFSFLCILLISYGCCITRPNCDPEKGNFKYGPEISYRTSSYWGEDAKDEDLKHTGGIGLGGYVHWTFCEEYPAMGIYSGLFYNQFGTRYPDDGSGETIKDRLSYLTIPFTFTYDVYKGIRLEAGPDLSFLLAAKEIYKFNGQKETYDFKEDVRKVQIGFNLAVSYIYEPLGLGGFIRYNGGLNRVPSSDFDTKAYNGGISFGARYRLNHLFYKGN
jgi:hypothetical protein